MLPSAEVHIETMELHAVESSDSECENTDDEFERHAGHAAGSEDSTDEGDTGDEEDSGPFQAPNGVTFYEALPPELSANLLWLMGCQLRIRSARVGKSGYLRDKRQKTKATKGST